MLCVAMVTQQQIIGHFHPAVAKDLLKRGFKVQARARLLLSGSAGHPKRVDTGLLRTSVQVRLMDTAGITTKVRVGTNRRYARWVHDGTGIYGPRKVPIKPRSAKALKFKAGYGGGGKKTIYARTVKGMKKNEFLKDALPAFKG